MRLKYEKVIHHAVVNNLFGFGYTKKSCNAQGSSKYYLFVTAPSNSDVIMAAVMGAGMIPPLAIGLSTLIFKERWTKEERGTTLKNIIMGLSFVSEGAIPFMKKDQKHILPACILGSFITGALSAYYKCGIKVPHGGIWVIYLMTNPFKYVIALLAGTIVAGLIITYTHKSEN